MINDNANDNAKNNANNTNDNSSSGSSSGSSTGRCGSGTRDETIEMKVCLVQIIRYLNHILFIWIIRTTIIMFSSSSISTTVIRWPRAAAEFGRRGSYIRREPVRFDSFRFRTFRKVIGSARFGSESRVSQFDAIQPVLFERIMARSGSVRLVSASGSGRFRNQTIRFGSASASSVRFLTPSCDWSHPAKGSWKESSTTIASTWSWASPSA